MARTKQTARISTGGLAPRKFLSLDSFNNMPQPQQQQQQQQPKPLEPPAPISKGMEEVIEKENYFRRLFATDRTNSELSDQHLLLTNVFDSPLQFEAEPADEIAMPKLLTKNRKLTTVGSSAVATREEFRANWSRFTQGALDGLDWTNVFAAGGSVLACLTPALAAGQASEDAFRGSDVDLFIHGLTSDRDANDKLRQIHRCICDNLRQRSAQQHSQYTDPQVIRTGRAVTIVGTFPVRNIQIILRLYKTPAEVLLGFDVDCCSVGFDGSDVWGSQRWCLAQKYSRNVVNPSRRSMNYETRLIKYSRRGYAVAVPDLDKSRVDPAIFDKQPHQVNGLCKLLLYEWFELKGTSSDQVFVSHSLPAARNLLKATHRRMWQLRQPGNEDFVERLQEYSDLEAANPSDYSDCFIPWGAGWHPLTVLNVLNYRDKAAFFSQLNAQRKLQRLQRRGDGAAGGSTSPKPAIQHCHMFVTGIDGAISGESSSFWCHLCSKKVPLEAPTEGTAVGKMTAVHGPLTWDKETPSLQDFDNGAVRMMTGAFRPGPITQPFDAGVYGQIVPMAHPLYTVQLNQQTATKPFQQFSFNNSAAATTTPAAPSAWTSKCSICSMPFPNDLARHRHEREVHAFQTQPPSTSFGVPVPSSSFGVPVPSSSFGVPVPSSSSSFGVPVSSSSFGATAVPARPFNGPVAASSFGEMFGTSSVSLPKQQQPSPFFPPRPAPPLPSSTSSSDAAVVELLKKVTDRVSMILLLVSTLAKQGKLSPMEKGKVKDLLFEGPTSPAHKFLMAALDVFMADGDLADLADTFTHITNKF